MRQHPNRRDFMGRQLLAGLGLLASAGAIPAWAAGQFSKPLQLIVPYGAGGPTDTLLRTLSAQAAQALGQEIVIENRPGANGTFGAAALARARDGHTIAVLPATVFREPFLTKVSFDPLKLSYIICMTNYVFGFAVSQDARWKNWQEFAQEAKQRPGQLTVGVTGATGTPRIVMGEVAQALGLELNIVPYKSDSDITTELLGGHLDAAAMTGTAVQYIRAGRMRYLAMLTEQRSELFPDLPTMRELGADTWVDSPFGLAGPPGMDAAQVQAVHDAFKQALESDAGRQALAQLNQPLNYMGPKEYAAYAAQSMAKEKARVQQLRAQGLLG
ncbi:tripartite tricarboxylate transporter substrate binding protein [Vandammella animalimorsus]|nr:tripartite tricarboxylate transporter substrate binding protein [Vandammella animalimorsus]